MQGIDTEIKLVGRTKELDELKSHLHNAIDGHGNSVFISGEAGVGKTRLLEELKTYAREQGVDVLQGWSLYEFQGWKLSIWFPIVDSQSKRS
ncbi:MAG: BREX system ATP-binding domain-containing protein [Candidatus Hodarchaeales archaeon]|jgi:ABC-type lipoprotein export system ATPase subunit